MSQARFVALLAVMLVIGVAHGAWSSDGDPVILGAFNKEQSLTQISGARGVQDTLYVSGHSYFDAIGPGWINTVGIHMNCTGYIVVQPGSSEARIDNAACLNPGPMMATLNGAVPHGVLLQSIHARPRHKGTSVIVVHLNKVTPVAVTVAYAGFSSSAWGPWGAGSRSP